MKRIEEKQRISLIARECLRERERSGLCSTEVAYGDLDILHEIYDRAGNRLKNEHPLNIHQYVLNALDRESKMDNAIFVKQYFRSDRGLARVFELIKT